MKDLAKTDFAGTSSPASPSVINWRTGRDVISEMWGGIPGRALVLKMVPEKQLSNKNITCLASI